LVGSLALNGWSVILNSNLPFEMKYKRFRRKAKYLFRKLGVVETCRKYSVSETL
jgi:hypothetical protein